MPAKKAAFTKKAVFAKKITPVKKTASVKKAVFAKKAASAKKTVLVTVPIQTVIRDGPFCLLYLRLVFSGNSNGNCRVGSSKRYTRYVCGKPKDGCQPISSRMAVTAIKYLMVFNFNICFNFIRLARFCEKVKKAFIDKKKREDGEEDENENEDEDEDEDEEIADIVTVPVVSGNVLNVIFSVFFIFLILVFVLDIVEEYRIAVVVFVLVFVDVIIFLF